MKYSARNLGRISHLQQIEQRVDPRPAAPPIEAPSLRESILGPRAPSWTHSNQRVEIATGSGRGARKVIWSR